MVVMGDANGQDSDPYGGGAGFMKPNLSQVLHVYPARDVEEGDQTEYWSLGRYAYRL